MEFSQRKNIMTLKRKKEIDRVTSKQREGTIWKEKKNG